MATEKIDELNIRHIEALAVKEEREAEKLRLEIKKLEKIEPKMPFYKDPMYLRPVIAGVSIALIFAGYFQYIFVPTQNRLIQKAESAEFRLQERKAEHAANLARVNLAKEQIRLSSEESSKRLKQAIGSLKEAQRINVALNKKIMSLSKTTKSKSEIVQLQKELMEEKEKLEVKIRDAQEAEVKIDVLAEAGKELAPSTSAEGWIYVGYYPGGKWNYHTLELGEEETIYEGKEYNVIENVNLRSNAPSLSIFGYKFGDSIGTIRPPRKIIVIEKDSVGLSKVWAKVKTIN